MAASSLFNVRCPKSVIMLSLRSTFRACELRIHTKAVRLARKIGNQVKTAAVQRNDGKDESMNVGQPSTHTPTVEDDFFGFLGGEGVTEVEPHQNGPVNVITKYEALMSVKRPSDMEKVYVTNFGIIRLDRDNQAKFHGQFDVVAEDRIKKRSDEFSESSDGFPEPQTEKKITLDRNFKHSHPGNAHDQQHGQKEIHKSSSYIDDQYFGDQLMNDTSCEQSSADDSVSPIDIGYFDKLYEREVASTKPDQEIKKMPLNPEICATNYTRDELTTPHKQSSNATKKQDPELSCLINEKFQQSDVPPMSGSSNKCATAANELPADVASESNEFHCNGSTLTHDKSYSTDVLNRLDNVSENDKHLQQETLQANKREKPNFLEESIIEYAASFETNGDQANITKEAWVDRLQVPPPFTLNLETNMENRIVDDSSDTFGDTANMVEKRHLNKQKQTLVREPKSKNESALITESGDTQQDTIAMIFSQVGVSEHVGASDDIDQHENKLIVPKGKNNRDLQMVTEFDRTKTKNTVFGTHPDLSTRQKTVESLAHAQRRSTTKLQLPPEAPVVDEDTKYEQPEDRHLPTRENIGLRVTVPEPRFDKKPKFPSRQSDDEPVFADEFVSEYLKEEVNKDSQDDHNFVEGEPVKLGQLQEKTQKLEEQPEFVVLQLLKDSIMYNNHDILVLYKPYGLPIQASKGYRHNLVKFLPELATFLDRKNPNPKLYTVHRIDRGTTGILVLAKTQEMANSLHSLFKNRKIHKTYWAITKGIPNPLQGIIKIPIAEGSVVGRRRMVLKPDYNKDTRLVVKKSSVAVAEAITPYRVLTAKGNAALVEATPQTGVTHQLRVHFGFGLGCPVLGDHKYTHHTSMAPQRLPADMLKRLDVRQSKVRDLPIHLHARSIVIPEILDAVGCKLWGLAVGRPLRRLLRSLFTSPLKWAPGCTDHIL